MNFLMPVVGGTVAGLIGAAVWAAIAHFAHREVGWVAWGVGGLVGLGVRIAAKEDDGPKFGVLAGVIAVLAILGGKYAGAHLIVADEAARLSGAAVSEDAMIGINAYSVAKERAAKGQKVAFRPGVTAETADSKIDYPPDVWAEATKRWKAQTPAEQAGRMEALKQLQNVGLEGAKGRARDRIFQDSFSAFDLLWFGLATFTAFRLGSGITSDD